MTGQVIEVKEDTVTVNGGGVRVVEREAVAITIKTIGEGPAGSCQLGITSKCGIAFERLAANRFDCLLYTSPSPRDS